MSKPTDVFDGTFESEVLQSDLPVLVDFWAEWCGPCKMIAPTVEELSTEYEGKVSFRKLNVDDSPMTAAQFGIRSIPTLLVFSEGKPVASIVGAVPKKEIVKHLEQVVG